MSNLCINIPLYSSSIALKAFDISGLILHKNLTYLSHFEGLNISTQSIVISCLNYQVLHRNQYTPFYQISMGRFNKEFISNLNAGNTHWMTQRWMQNKLYLNCCNMSTDSIFPGDNDASGSGYWLLGMYVECEIRNWLR